MMKRIKAAGLAALLAGLMLTAACAPAVNHVDGPASPAPTPAEVSTPEPTPSPTAAPTPTPMLTPTPEPTAAPVTIDSVIAAMSDRELIGQMVMIGFNGTEDMDSESAQLMKDYGVGNVMLFGWNTKTFEQTKALTARIQSHGANGVPVMIGIDLEGGRVVRFSGQWKPKLSSAQALGKKNDPQRVYEQYRQIGQTLREIGIAVDFAPVLDIAKEPTFLGSRVFGGDADKVAALTREAVKGLHDGGVASLGKHFPGHGYTTEDSHETLPVINVSRDKMEAYSLIPFASAVDEGIDAILVAHLKFPKIDRDYIASVSPVFITDMLRGDMNFNGVVISDDMRMMGLRSQYSVGEGAVLHILAGGDIVLVGLHGKLQKQALDALYQAVQDGRIGRARLEQSVRRILTLKQAYMGFLPA